MLAFAHMRGTIHVTGTLVITSKCQTNRSPGLQHVPCMFKQAVGVGKF